MTADHLSEVRIMVGARPRRVFAELGDGWSYAGWVVGASHIRDVDAEWPAVGTRIHHKVGTWPTVVADTTEVLEYEPDRRLLLKARAWPAGEAHVEFSLVPMGHSTQIVLTESPVSGAARLLDNRLGKALLRWRNRETLHRLADRVERRPRPAPAAEPDAG